ncbi:NUDIX domain-containing protein [Bacillus sp. ISL-35]|uniref:NUDIX hydrolase n=1 Tax=Bacillus sp. ISL-35 TaxID=2819122 RepID=UPI001BE7A0C4|nr:NUDIX domain-containing protein [Bacillus sp. ISL-35]MBT2679484.1 NUDIX domain-containing protein [Bacillus sp. ISL-35]MBT2703387.1 NUDIX domain-containing protein [Chryseobacterium sp. ISL-80]
MVSTYVNWGESKVKLTWKESDELPPVNLITSVHGFCFLDNKLLLVKLKHRGWDMTGGHIEPDESPEECFKRETLEEAYVAGDCSLLGHMIVDHSENPQWNEKSPYPKIGFQVFYSMDITEVHDFEAGFESTERIFIDHNRVQDYYHDWHELYAHILGCARKNTRLR